MAIEITHGKDYMVMTDTRDNTHKLVIEEDDKFLTVSVEYKNEHDSYFDEMDKELIKKILEEGTRQQLAEYLNLQFFTEYDSLVDLLKAEGEMLKRANREQLLQK